MSDEAKIILKDMQIEEMRKEIISQDQFIAQLEKEYDKEIKRLNNIVNKLDKLIEQYSKNDYYYKYNGKYLKSEIINDLKELKGSDKE